MLTPDLHPWQEGPVGLLRFARDTSRSPDQLNQLVAFLLLDVCVETTMRTFLSLPDGLVPGTIKYFERRRFSEGNFHDLTRGVEAVCVTPIAPTDLHYVKYYHAKRNQLYHQGSGITVAAGDVERYMRVAASLLDQLLGVGQEVAPASAEGASSLTKEQVARLGAELRRNIEQFRELVNALFETIEPKLVYPTTIKRLSTIASGIDAVSFPRKLSDFRQLIDSTIEDQEIKTWLLDFLADDVSGDSEQTLRNSQFLMEASKDHYALYSLIAGVFFLPVGDVRKDSVDRYEDISFLAQDDYSIMGIYTACLSFAGYIAHAEGRMIFENPPLIERGIEVNDKLVDTIKRLSFLTKA